VSVLKEMVVEISMLSFEVVSVVIERNFAVSGVGFRDSREVGFNDDRWPALTMRTYLVAITRMNCY
jgi:hypothetical protein